MPFSYKDKYNPFRLWNDLSLLTFSFFFTFSILHQSTSNKYFLLLFGFWFFLMIGWYFTSQSNHTYDQFKNRTLSRQLLRTAHNIFIQLCLFILFSFSLQFPSNSRKTVIVYIALLCILIPLEKIFYNRVMQYLFKKGINKKKLIIIGAGKTGLAFHKLIDTHQHLGFEILGFLDDEPKENLPSPHLGNIQHLGSFIDKDIADVDEVIVALPNHAHYIIQNISSLIGQKPVKLRIIPAFSEYINTSYKIGVFGGFPIVTVRNEPLEDIHLRTLKRAFDVVFSIFALVFVCSWLFPIIAILIKLNSKGPVLFIQNRWGRKNKEIKCFKFRSMYTTSRDQDDSGKFQQAQKYDPRITPIGRFLRKTNLDEFPQFLNVLMGTMSVVGPRPHAVPHNLESKDTIDKYEVRHLVKPGITGWAQVNGLRGDTSDPSLMQARVEFDIWYIENWSLLLDLKIIFLTFWNTIVGDKNAF